MAHMELGWVDLHTLTSQIRGLRVSSYPALSESAAVKQALGAIYCEDA
jgi:hypothetical protein